jgi:periplasmic protein TonB
MLKNRHFISYFSTTLLYMATIGLFFYIQQQTKISTERSEEKVMQVMLSDFMPEIIPVEEIPLVKEVEELEIEKKEFVEPEVIKEPIPEEIVKVVEEKIPEPIIPKPIIKKSKKKIEVKKIVKKKKPAKKKPIKKASRASSKKTQANPEKVNKFYKQIRVKINKNKSYPKIAKRRRMQGTVKVTFTVLRSGKVANIIMAGPKVFHNSARHAIQSAFPISVKNIPVTLPTTVSVPLHYQIR